MLFKTLSVLSLLSVLPSILACPDHSFHPQIKKRAETNNVSWAYEASYDWARLSDGKPQNRHSTNVSLKRANA